MAIYNSEYMSTTTSCRIAIILFPGSNYELETRYAIEQAGMVGEEFLWNGDLAVLAGFDGYFVSGGFSYEDRIRSGVISSKHPLIQTLYAQARLGKPILGVCNGAQILVESGLVPGYENLELGAALAFNRRMRDGVILGTGFYNNHVKIKIANNMTAFTNAFKLGEIVDVVVAHGEGKFMFEDYALQDVLKNQLITTQYCDSTGEIDPHFPTNPNGSTMNIASIVNPSGNIMAIMPHPERTDSGRGFFVSMRKYIEDLQSGKLNFEFKELSKPQNLPKLEPKNFVLNSNERMVVIKLKITDKEQQTTQMILDQGGVNSTITKYIGYKITFKDSLGNSEIESVIAKIIESEELFNPNKEKTVEFQTLCELSSKSNSNLVLITNKEDDEGTDKLQILQSLDMQTFTHIESIGKLWMWNIEGNSAQIMDMNLLANPISQEVYKTKN
jgi:phosphoribosylformylglycinamidine synthase subunit PurQ / glutaminase